MNIYSLKNVTKRYGENENAVTALDNVSADIRKGAFIVILGASGSGKSTLLNILGGIDQCTSGKVLFEKQDLSRYGGKRLTAFRKEKIGFVFQHYNLIANLTALENVEFACEISKVDRGRAKDMLGRVGLSHRGDHYPSELSGGEQQRVSIARAIVKNPTVLLCDEPTGALDVKTGVAVLGILKTINKEDGATVVTVTHNADICRIADVTVSMRDGRIIEQKQRGNPNMPDEIDW
ncbi:MAG: ABC transporter ATP-binding protein [Clostridiales Family XIII bacterium]|nr:ABC transporter ATP-binding protein [Clostridiales Family XIII bacterium]